MTEIKAKAAGCGEESRALLTGGAIATFRAAVEDVGIEPGLARAVCPRGACRSGACLSRSVVMPKWPCFEAINAADLSEMKFRDRWPLRCVRGWTRSRIRRWCGGAWRSFRCRSLYAPEGRAGGLGHLPIGSGSLWATHRDDINWYTKRMTLSGVYSATVLYWLGDDSPGHESTAGPFWTDGSRT